MNRSKYHWYEI